MNRLFLLAAVVSMASIMGFQENVASAEEPSPDPRSFPKLEATVGVVRTSGFQPGPAGSVVMTTTTTTSQGEEPLARLEASGQVASNGSGAPVIPQAALHGEATLPSGGTVGLGYRRVLGLDRKHDGYISLVSRGIERDAGATVSALGTGEAGYMQSGDKDFPYLRLRGEFMVKDCANITSDGKNQLCAKAGLGASLGLVQWVELNAQAGASYERAISGNGSKLYVEAAGQAHLSGDVAGGHSMTVLGATAGIATF